MTCHPHSAQWKSTLSFAGQISDVFPEVSCDTLAVLSRAIFVSDSCSQKLIAVVVGNDRLTWLTCAVHCLNSEVVQVDRFVNLPDAELRVGACRWFKDVLGRQGPRTGDVRASRAAAGPGCHSDVIRDDGSIAAAASSSRGVVVCRQTAQLHHAT